MERLAVACWLSLGSEPVCRVVASDSKNRDRLLDGDIAAKCPGRGAGPAAGKARCLEGAVARSYVDLDRGVGEHEELQAQAGTGR